MLTFRSRSFRAKLALAAGVAILAWGGSQALRAAAPYDPALFSGLKWRMLGPFRGGRVDAVTGVPGRPNEFYHGRRERRRLEDRGCRPRLGAGVRRAADRLDWRHRGGRLGAKHDLRRQRRVDAPRLHGLRQRDVQVDRCRRDVDAHRPGEHPAHRTRGGRSQEPERRVRRGHRTPLRCSSRSRRLQDDRRRPNVDEVALQERFGRRVRRHHRSDELSGGLRVALEHAAANLVHVPAEQRTRRRDLQVRRRRREVDGAEEWASGRVYRQGRPWRVSEQPAAHLRAD